VFRVARMRALLSNLRELSSSKGVFSQPGLWGSYQCYTILSKLQSSTSLSTLPGTVGIVLERSLERSSKPRERKGQEGRLSHGVPSTRHQGPAIWLSRYPNVLQIQWRLTT